MTGFVTDSERGLCLSASDQLALHRLVFEHWARVDRIDEACAGELYTQDAVMRIGALQFDGRADIERYFGERRAQEDLSGRRSRHQVTNLIVDTDGHGGATVCFLAVVYAGAGDMPFAAGPPTTIADFTTICRRQDDGRWLFQSMCARVVTKGPGAASHVN